jgi:predicted HTH domain antitoxin
MSDTNTIHIDIDIPEKIFFSIGDELNSFKGNVKLYIAIFMFQTHKLSIGKASEFAGISKDLFIEILEQYKIPIINYPAEELSIELKRLQEC